MRLLDSSKYQLAVSRLIAKYTDKVRMLKISTKVIALSVSDCTNHYLLCESVNRHYWMRI